MIAADVLEKLKGFAIGARDRRLIYLSLVFVAGLVAYLAVFGKDTKLHQDALSNLIWAGVSLVVVFVAGSVESRRVAAKTIAPKVPGETQP